MWCIWLSCILVASSTALQSRFQCETQQYLQNMTEGPSRTLTTLNGVPVDLSDIDAVNGDLINNLYFMETMTHLNRERIPERVVHARGAGAFGYFEATKDISHICKAKVFSQGKRTPVAVRFSEVVGSLDAVDTKRDNRGFAVKFYTEEGNLDLVGLNVEMFLIKDPTLFPSFVHAFKRNPKTNLYDFNTQWDFITLRPETLNMFMRYFDSRDLPDGYRHMPGYAIHTFQVYNERGIITFVRFRFEPEKGHRNLTIEEATKLAGTDPDYAIRDLYKAIAKGDHPRWDVKIQVATQRDLQTAKFNLFDITIMWPEDEYPPMTIGRLVLDRNPVNAFAEVEQLAFCPSNLVPGILGGADKVFEARRLAYKDAQNYRLGANFEKIPVNCPLRASTNNRDGVSPIGDNEWDSPNYYPNSFNGPVPLKDKNPSLFKYWVDPLPKNFDQAADIYNSLNKEEQTRLVDAVLTGLSVTNEFIQDRAVRLYSRIHLDLGLKITNGLKARKKKC